MLHLVLCIQGFHAVGKIVKVQSLLWCVLLKALEYWMLSLERLSNGLENKTSHLIVDIFVSYYCMSTMLKYLQQLMQKNVKFMYIWNCPQLMQVISIAIQVKGSPPPPTLGKAYLILLLWQIFGKLWYFLCPTWVCLEQRWPKFYHLPFPRPLEGVFKGIYYMHT